MALVTAGCGISQLNFDKWPTWPKYCVLTHQCKHINVGGPASGNEHIARSIIRTIYETDVDCVIVVWTNYDKLDLYVENEDLYNKIKGFPTRNFLINHYGKIIDAPGYWPSSLSDDNEIKQWYKDNIESQTYYYIRTLENILSVQTLCKLKQIPCYMFIGYSFDFEYIKQHQELNYLYNAIDWSLFVSMDPIEDTYETSNWFNYNTTGEHGLIPVAGWHYEFYKTYIKPILDRHYSQRDLDKFNELEAEVMRITQQKFEQKIS